MEEKLLIRPARPSDTDALVELVRGLNEHQRDPTEYFDAAALARDVFAPDAILRVLVAERAGSLIGYAFFHDGYESSYAQAGIYLCDLYVASKARRSGAGRALVARVAAEAKAAGRTFVWWAVKDWNEEARAFYAALGASSEPVTAHAIVFDTFETLAEEGK